MRRILSGIVLSITILSAACGGQASSPLSPSGIPPAPASSTTGATVVGTVRLGLTAPVVGSSADVMKVEVVGAAIVAVVSAAGQFELGNVPAGQVRLHFFGAGVDAYVTIQDVTSGETATITVTVVGTTAVLESQQRNCTGEQQQVEGRIESLPPTQPAGALVVSGRTITTNAQTVIKQGSLTSTFADLEVGQRVHVKGTVTGTTFVASLIEIQNTQTDLPVIVNGIVSGLTGHELAFQFTVAGSLVKGDGLTQFYGNSTFVALKNGARVEVKGLQQDGSVYAIRIHVQDAKAISFVGTLTSKTGAAPALTLVVGGTTVYTSAATVVQRKNATLPVGDVRVGDVLRIEGTAREDGSIDALKIEIKDSDSGAPIDLSGAVWNRSGGCPQLTFTVDGRTVVTDSKTVYVKTSCAELKNGDQVEVKGYKQPDGSVVASKITGPASEKDTTYEGKGTVSNLSGSCPSVTFTLSATAITSGWSVKVSTSGSTAFTGAGCAGLRNGVKIEVKGTKQADGSVIATKVDVEEQKETPYSASGTVSSVSGECPALNFMLTPSAITSGTSVKIYTNSGTTFAGAGCAGLKNGVKVEVKATKRTDGTIVADKVTVEEPKSGTAYEGKGTIGSLSGSCPSVTFALTVTSIVSTSTVTVNTNSSTVFSSVGCGDLKAGLKVSVTGAKQADGKVLATKVQKG